MDDPPNSLSRFSLESLEDLLDEAANNLEEGNDDKAPPAASKTPMRPLEVKIIISKRALKRKNIFKS